MTKPVYIINGFLESGKTEFITFTLGQPYFQIKGKTLLILCEEGENEYDPALLKKSHTDVVLIEEEEEFTPNHLIELEKQYKPARIIIEYNGMWNCKNMTLPWYWKVEQQITTIDGSTFPMYYTNMKSLLAEMIRKSEMIIFNRCDGIKDLNVYKRNIKAVNPSADVIFEDSNGEIDEIFEEDLPYDLNQDPIVLDNQGYGIWYLDSMDHLEVCGSSLWIWLAAVVGIGAWNMLIGILIACSIVSLLLIMFVAPGRPVAAHEEIHHHA